MLRLPYNVPLNAIKRLKYEKKLKTYTEKKKFYVYNADTTARVDVVLYCKNVHSGFSLFFMFLLECYMVKYYSLCTYNEYNSDNWKL